MGQFIATLPDATLPAIEIVVPDTRAQRPTVRRIARCDSPVFSLAAGRVVGPARYQFPNLDAAMRWIAGYCGPWGCTIRELLHQLRTEEETQALS